MVRPLQQRENKRDNENEVEEEEEEEEEMVSRSILLFHAANESRKRKKRARFKSAIKRRGREERREVCLIAVTLLENLAEVPLNFEWPVSYSGFDGLPKSHRAIMHCHKSMFSIP